MKNKSSNLRNAGSAALPRIMSFMLATCLAVTWTSTSRADGDRGDNSGRGDNQGQGNDADQDNNGGRGDEGEGNGYQQINLVADLAGVAMLQDTNLVNAWGISFGPNTPFWISDNGMGLATLYAVTNDNMGMPHVAKQGLEVSIPGEGSPTGQLFNNTRGFHTNLFIFASEDGTISGWRPALGTAAETLVAASPKSVYKGITLISNSSGPMLLVANFRQAKIDVYDGQMNLVHQYGDTNAPSDYAPFNVEAINGMVFVTFAKQDAAMHDDIPGPGNGLIDILDPMTGMFQRLVTGTDAGGNNHAVNSPWGMVISPDNFGEHSDQLLVGNFRGGTIMSFDDHVRFEGLLKDAKHRTLIIDGLWSLTVGNGTKAGVPDALYFTAGPDSEQHGLFGSLVPAKKAVQGHRRDND